MKTYLKWKKIDKGNDDARFEVGNKAFNLPSKKSPSFRWGMNWTIV
jgi:hypothetical protein